MKILAVIKKALIMQWRDYWALLLTILSAPFFVFIYFIITSGGSTTYTLHYAYNDTADSSKLKKEILYQLNGVKYSNGISSLRIVESSDTAASKVLIKNREVDLLLMIPKGFADSLKTGKAPNFQIFGEASNPKYSVGLIFTITGIESFVRQYSPIKPIYTFEEKFMGNSQAKSEFDVYAPGIFIFAIIMLILSASLAIIRDVEDKTMLRLKLSRMTVLDYLVGNSIVQWMVGILSFAATYLLALSLGFHSQGSIWLVLLVCSLIILSMIGICLILVAFCRSATMVLIVGNFPLFILMFFTGSMIPMPRNEIIAGFAWNDFLSPTHGVVAMNKIFTFGATISDLKYEMVMMSILTIVYYAIGIYFFKKRHLNVV
jgi:ABC-2 type transport system permease protein